MSKVGKPRLVCGSSTSGLAALFMIVLIGAVGLLVALGASSLGLGELDQGYTAQKGGEAFAIADGCVEETLQRIKMNNTYGLGAGTITLSVPNGTCQLTVTDLGSNQRRIVGTGIVGNNYYRRIQVDLTLSSGVITINSWQEV